MSNRPKSIEEFISLMGPYDPPLTEAERWHVQQWLDDPGGFLMLRSPVFIASRYVERMGLPLPKCDQYLTAKLQCILPRGHDGLHEARMRTVPCTQCGKDMSLHKLNEDRYGMFNPRDAVKCPGEDS